MAQTIEQIVRARVVVTGEQKLDVLNRKLKALKQNAGEFGKTFGSAFREATRGMQQVERGTQAMRREMARARSDIDATARSFGTMRAEAERARAAVRDIGRAGGGGGGLGAMARQASAIRRDMQAAATASARAGRGGGGPRDPGAPRRPPGLSTARTASGFDGPGAATRTRTQSTAFDASADRIVSALNQVSSRLERATSATDRQQRGTQTQPAGGGGLPLAIGTRDPGAAQAALATMAAARSIADMTQRIRAMANTAGVTVGASRAGVTTRDAHAQLAAAFQKAMRGSRKDLVGFIDRVNLPSAFGMQAAQRNRILADLAGRPESRVRNSGTRADAISAAYDRIHGGATPRRGRRPSGLSTLGAFEIAAMASAFMPALASAASLPLNSSYRRRRLGAAAAGGMASASLFMVNPALSLGIAGLTGLGMGASHIQEAMHRRSAGRKARAIMGQIEGDRMVKALRRQEAQDRATRARRVPWMMEQEDRRTRYANRGKLADVMQGIHDQDEAVRRAASVAATQKKWADTRVRSEAGMRSASAFGPEPLGASIARVRTITSAQEARAAAQASRDAMMSDARMRAIAMGGADPATVAGHRVGPPPLPMARGVTGGAASAALIRAAASLDRAAAALTRAAMSLAGGRGGQRVGSYVGPSGPDLHGFMRSRATLDALSGRHDALRGQNTRNRGQATMREYRRIADQFTASGGTSVDAMRKIAELNQRAQRLIAHRVARAAGYSSRPSAPFALDFLQGIHRDAFRRGGGGSTLASGLGGMERYLPSWLGGSTGSPAPIARRGVPPAASAGSPDLAAIDSYRRAAAQRVLDGGHPATVGGLDRSLTRTRSLGGGSSSGGGGGGGITGLGGIGDMAAGGALARFMSRSSTGLGLRQIGAYMGVASVGAGAAQAIKVMANTQASAIEANAVTQGTGAEKLDLQKRIRDLAKSSPFTEADLFGASKYMGMAGLSAARQRELMPVVNDVALASGVSLPRAADLVTNIATTTGDIKGIPVLADKMTALYTSTNNSLEQLAQAGKYGLSTARALGFSTDDSLIMMGMAGNVGMQGTLGGTGHRTFLSKLTTLTGKQKESLKGLGADLFDEDGQLKSKQLPYILSQLQTAKNKDQGKVAEIFRQRAGQYLFGILSQIEDDPTLWDNLQAQIAGAEGRTRTLAGAKMEGLVGAWKEFTSRIDAMVNTIGENGATKALTNVTKAATGVADAVQDIVENPRLAYDLATDGKLGMLRNNLSQNEFEQMRASGGDLIDLKVKAAALQKEIDARYELVKQMSRNRVLHGPDGGFRSSDDAAPVPVKVVPTTNEEPWWQRNAPSRWFGGDAKPTADKWGIPFDTSKLTSKDEVAKLIRYMETGDDKFGDPASLPALKRLRDRYMELDRLQGLSPVVPLTPAPTGRTIWDMLNPFPPAHAGEIPQHLRGVPQSPGDAPLPGGGASTTSAVYAELAGVATALAGLSGAINNGTGQVAAAIGGLAGAISSGAAAISSAASAAGAAGNGRLVAREAPSRSGGAAP